MRLIGLALAAGAAVLAAAAPAAAAPPQNDNYLQSIPLNQPGSALLPDPLRDSTDTTEATVQSDLFNPQADGTPGSGGPAETTTCRLPNGQVSSFGRTVWYDAYPPTDGLLRVVALGGFDSVISVVPFDRSAIPDYRSQQCADFDASASEELIAQLRAGQPYTIQVGGFDAGSGPGGGPLQVDFQFAPDSDGDGVLDVSDRCRRTPGSLANGCPRRLDREVRAPYRWDGAAGGVRLRFLKLDVPRGARVRMTCTKRACRRVSRRASTITQPVGPVRMSARKGRSEPLAGASSAPAPKAYAARTLSLLRNKRLRNGTRIDVRVTQRNSVGVLIRHTVRNGEMKQVRFCMKPGSSKPRRKCR